MKLTDEEIVYFNIVIREWLDKPDMRRGQAYFNALYQVNPQVANEIRGTELDPFYDDSRVEKLMNVIGVWDTMA